MFPAFLSILYDCGFYGLEKRRTDSGHEKGGTTEGQSVSQSVGHPGSGDLQSPRRTMGRTDGRLESVRREEWENTPRNDVMSNDK